MRFAVRVDRRLRKADAARTRLRALAVAVASSSEPRLKGLPSSSVLTPAADRSPERPHDGARPS